MTEPTTGLSCPPEISYVDLGNTGQIICILFDGPILTALEFATYLAFHNRSEKVVDS